MRFACYVCNASKSREAPACTAYQSSCHSEGSPDDSRGPIQLLQEPRLPELCVDRRGQEGTTGDADDTLRPGQGRAEPQRYPLLQVEAKAPSDLDGDDPSGMRNRSQRTGPPELGFGGLICAATGLTEIAFWNGELVRTTFNADSKYATAST